MKKFRILTLFWYFIKRIFSRNAVKQFVSEFIEPSIEIAEAVKKALNSKSVDILVELTKTDLDDKWRDRVVEIVSKAIDRMYKIDLWAKVDSKTKKPVKLTHEEVVKAFIDHVRNEKPAMQGAILSKLSSVIAQNQSKKIGKEFETDTISNLTYAYKKATGKSSVV